MGLYCGVTAAFALLLMCPNATSGFAFTTHHTSIYSKTNIRPNRPNNSLLMVHFADIAQYTLPFVEISALLIALPLVVFKSDGSFTSSNDPASSSSTFPSPSPSPSPNPTLSEEEVEAAIDKKIRAQLEGEFASREAKRLEKETKKEELRKERMIKLEESIKYAEAEEERVRKNQEEAVRIAAEKAEKKRLENEAEGIVEDLAEEKNEEDMTPAERKAQRAKAVALRDADAKAAFREEP